MSSMRFDARFTSLGAVAVLAIAEGRRWSEVFDRVELRPGLVPKQNINAGLIAQAVLVILDEATTREGVGEVIKSMQLLHNLDTGNLPKGPTRAPGVEA